MKFFTVKKETQGQKKGSLSPYNPYHIIFYFYFFTSYLTYLWPVPYISHFFFLLCLIIILRVTGTEVSNQSNVYLLTLYNYFIFFPLYYSEKKVLMHIGSWLHYHHHHIPYPSLPYPSLLSPPPPPPAPDTLPPGLNLVAVFSGLLPGVSLT